MPSFSLLSSLSSEIDNLGLESESQCVHYLAELAYRKDAKQSFPDTEIHYLQAEIPLMPETSYALIYK